MVLIAAWLALAGALSEGSVNGSGRGTGFVWQGALLRPCTSSKTAACQAGMPRPVAVPGAAGLRLRQNVQQSPVVVRAQGKSHSSGYAHEHGPDGGEHTEPPAPAGPGVAPHKVRHHFMLVMDAAAEVNRPTETHEDCGHDHSGHGHSHESAPAPSMGHTHEAGASAACNDADCGHDHGGGTGHSHSHQQARSHSHSGAPSKSKQAEAEAATSNTPAISDGEMIRKMFGVFLSGQGGVAAALGCISVLLATKLVKVSVPFFYQYVLDTLGTGAMSAPDWVASAIAGVASGQLGSTAMVLIVLYTVTKIVAQFMQSANDVVFRCGSILRFVCRFCRSLWAYSTSIFDNWKSLLTSAF